MNTVTEGLVGRSLVKSLIDRWWLFLVRGILAILFGVLTLFRPGAALAVVVLLFGAWALVDGIHALVMSFSGHRSWQLALIGVLGIAAGVITFGWPGITLVGLYAVVAVWAIAHGIVEIELAVELRHEIRGEGWLILGGISSILFGVLLIALPAAGVMALIWLLAFYALWFGGVMLLVAFRLRDVHNQWPRVVGTPQPA
jgi:uncharacterized membrane protein HdeD (DUF308 family)